MANLEEANKVGFGGKLREEVVALLGRSDGKAAKFLWKALESSLLGLPVMRTVALLLLKKKTTGDPKAFFRQLAKINEKVEQKLISREIDAERIQAETSGSGVLPLEL